MWYKKQSYWNRNEFFLQFKESYIFENIDIFKPKIKLRNTTIFKDVPINTNLKPTEKLFNLAIDYGMILVIDYKGDDDNLIQGHNRVICPIAIGKSKDNKLLIQAYHLKGWSVKENTYVEKEWRVFRFDRILNVYFPGTFFRNINTNFEKINFKVTKKLDTNTVRNNQHKLLMSNNIDISDRVIINKLKTVELEDLKTSNIKDLPNDKNIRCTIAKSIFNKNEYIAILGASFVKSSKFKYNNVNYISIGWWYLNNLPKHYNLQFYLLKNIK